MIKLPIYGNEQNNDNKITNFLIEIDGLNYGCEESLFDEKCWECFEFVSRLIDVFIYKGDYAIKNVKLNRVDGYMVFFYELINEKGSESTPVGIINRISEIDDKEKKIVFNGVTCNSYEEVLYKIEKLIDELTL